MKPVTTKEGKLVKITHLTLIDIYIRVFHMCLTKEKNSERLVRNNTCKICTSNLQNDHIRWYDLYSQGYQTCSTLRKSLLVVGQFNVDGYNILEKRVDCDKEKSHDFSERVIVGKPHQLIEEIMVDDATVANIATELVMTWKRCLGHNSKKGPLELLHCNLFPYLKSSDSYFCENCLYGKHYKASFQKSQN